MNDHDRARLDASMRAEDPLFDDESDEPGPWFTAGYESPCAHGDTITEGEEIRATGDGEWEHRECAEAFGVPSRSPFRYRGVTEPAFDEPGPWNDIR